MFNICYFGDENWVLFKTDDFFAVWKSPFNKFLNKNNLFSKSSRKSAYITSTPTTLKVQHRLLRTEQTKPNCNNILILHYYGKCIPPPEKYTLTVCLILCFGEQEGRWWSSPPSTRTQRLCQRCFPEWGKKPASTLFINKLNPSPLLDSLIPSHFEGDRRLTILICFELGIFKFNVVLRQHLKCLFSLNLNKHLNKIKATLLHGFILRLLLSSHKAEYMLAISASVYYNIVVPTNKVNYGWFNTSLRVRIRGVRMTQRDWDWKKNQKNKHFRLIFYNNLINFSSNW